MFHNCGTTPFQIIVLYSVFVLDVDHIICCHSSPVCFIGIVLITPSCRIRLSFLFLAIVFSMSFLVFVVDLTFFSAPVNLVVVVDIIMIATSIFFICCLSLWLIVIFVLPNGLCIWHWKSHLCHWQPSLLLFIISFFIIDCLIFCC
jgi:hypothetical protein